MHLWRYMHPIPVGILPHYLHILILLLWVSDNTCICLRGGKRQLHLVRDVFHEALGTSKASQPPNAPEGKRLRTHCCCVCFDFPCYSCSLRFVSSLKEGNDKQSAKRPVASRPSTEDMCITVGFSGGGRIRPKSTLQTLNTFEPNGYFELNPMLALGTQWIAPVSIWKLVL